MDQANISSIDLHVFMDLILRLKLTLLSLLLQITGLAFSSIDPDYIYIQGVDYEVIGFKDTRAEIIFLFIAPFIWYFQLGMNYCFFLASSSSFDHPTYNSI